MLYFVILIAGASFGSFFYTLALRYIDGMVMEEPFKAFFSRSRCPSCGAEIGFIYLVPVLGYFFARGRCRNCGEKISLSYPAWEFLYAVLALALFAVMGLSFYSLSVYMILSFCVCISIVDYEDMTIPDSMLLAVFFFSLYPVFISGDITGHLAGFAAVGAFFLIILFLFPGSFGGGDLKLFSLAGFIFGLEMSVVFLEITLVGSAVTASVWALLSGRGLRIRIPFAPFITAGMIATFLAGDRLLLLYYSLVFNGA